MVIFSFLTVGKVVVMLVVMFPFNILVLRALYFYDCETFWDFHMQHIILLLKKEGKS